MKKELQDRHLSAQDRFGPATDRMIDMNVYIVTLDNEPFCVTLSEQEAFGVFDRSVRMGGYRHASVDVVVASTNSRRVLQEAFGAQAA